ALPLLPARNKEGRSAERPPLYLFLLPCLFLYLPFFSLRLLLQLSFSRPNAFSSSLICVFSPPHSDAGGPAYPCRNRQRLDGHPYNHEVQRLPAPIGAFLLLTR